MSSEHRLRLKTLAMVFVMVACANAGDVLLKHGMNQIGVVQFTAAGLQHAFWATISSVTIWLAILFLIGFQVTFMTVVSWADYSYVMPAGAFGYAVVTFLARFVLGEQVTAVRWLGVVLICGGVLLVSQTKPRTTEAAT